MRVKKIIKQRITKQKGSQTKKKPRNIKNTKPSRPLIPNYTKIKQILIELQKVEDVVNIVKVQLKELESWKGKLEDTLYTYVNQNGDKSCKEIKQEILRDIQNNKVDGGIKKQHKKGNQPSEVKYFSQGYNAKTNINTKENKMNLHKSNRKGSVMKNENNQNLPPSIISSDKLREADTHIKEVRVYTEKGFTTLYRCLICKKTLSAKHTCRYHVRRVHYGERMGCSKCNSQFSQFSKLSQHRKTCLGNSSRNQDENTNIQKKKGRAPKKSKVSYENIKVRNPFKNFSLSKCLNVQVLIEPLPVPENIQNLIDENPQRTKRRLKLAAAFQQSSIDFPKKRKTMNLLQTKTQSVLPPPPPLPSSFSSYKPRQKMGGPKSAQKQRKKQQTIPFGLTNDNNFQFGQQFLASSNIINPYTLPYVVKQEGIGNPSSDMEGVVNEGEEILPIVDGSYACIRCNEFFPSASDLKMHHLLHGHPIASTANTVNLGFADMMDMNVTNGIPIDSYFPGQAINPNNFNEFQDFTSQQQQNFANEFIPVGVPSYFINNSSSTFPSTSSSTLTGQNQSRAPIKQLTKQEQSKFIKSKIHEHFTEEGSEFECLVCNKMFKGRPNVVQHVKRMHFGDAFGRACSGCSQSFFDQRALNAHQSKCEEYKELTAASLQDNINEGNDSSSSVT